VAQGNGLQIRKIVGSNPTFTSKFGLKVFMDAHGTVTAEEWGSLPPEAAKLKSRKTHKFDKYLYENMS
jgi:hypothetical protein